MPSKKLPAPERRCQMKREDGKQCRAARLRDSDYCLYHHPWTRSHREKLYQITNLPLKEARELHELLVGTIKGVKEGEINPQQAYAIGWLVRLLREYRVELDRERQAAKEEGLIKEKEPEFVEPAGAEEETAEEVELEDNEEVPMERSST